MQTDDENITDAEFVVIPPPMEADQIAKWALFAARWILVAFGVLMTLLVGLDGGLH